MRAGYGPGLVGSRRSGAGAQRLTHVGPRQQLRPQVLHVLDAPAGAPQDAEPHVGPPVRQRERPRVAGQQVGLEPDPQAFGRVAGDTVEVLPERVPLTEVTRLPAPERLAHGRPHPVGRHHVARRDRAEGVDVDQEPVIALFDDVGEAVPVVHLDAGVPGDVHQRGVELDTGRDDRELTLTAREREPDLPSGRGADPRGSTGRQLGTDAGSSPSDSSRRSAAVVRPSPQHLSRGNCARSTTTTSRPAWANSMAAAIPPGPPPTTTTSALITAGQGTAERRPSRRAARSRRSKRWSHCAPAATSHRTASTRGSGTAR